MLWEVNAGRITDRWLRDETDVKNLLADNYQLLFGALSHPFISNLSRCTEYAK
jgi:hypothetical protein